jgi:hypothetical protein
MLCSQEKVYQRQGPYFPLGDKLHTALSHLRLWMQKWDYLTSMPTGSCELKDKRELSRRKSGVANWHACADGLCQVGWAADTS